MEPNDTLKQTAIERILGSQTGRTSDSGGAREREESQKEVLYTVASAFVATPELMYDAHRRGCGVLKDRLREVLEKIQALPSLLNPPNTPFGTPSYQNLQRVLQRISSTTPLTAPIYQDLEREILKVQGPISVLGRRLEGDREAAMSLVLALDPFFDEVFLQVRRLSECLLSFGRVDFGQVLRERTLSSGKREVARIQKEGQKDGGLQVLTILAALKASRQEGLYRFYPKKPSQLRNEPRSTKYPYTSSRLVSADGSFFLTDPLPVSLTVGSFPQKATLPPSPAPALLGRATEKHAWTESMDTGFWSFAFGGDHLLRLYVRRSNGRSSDASVLIPEGTYSGSEMASFLNNAWTNLGVSDAVEATFLGTLAFQGKGGAKLALAPCSAASVVFGLTPTGGFDLHAGALVESTRTDAGPFSLSDSNNLLPLSFRSPATGLLETLNVVLPVGGSVSASSIVSAINAALANRQMDHIYSAAVDGSRLYLAHLTSDPGYVFSVLPSAAATTLGWSVQEVETRYDNRTLQWYLISTEPVFEVIESWNLSSYTGLHSADGLASILMEVVGNSYKVVASGPPGARSLSVYYQGAGASVVGLRAVEGGGLSRYLDFLPGATIYGRESTWLDVLPALQAGWVGVNLRLEQSQYVEVFLSFSPTGLGVGQSFRVRGEGQILGEAEGPGTLLFQTSTALQVGERVKLTSPPYAGSVGQVIAAMGDEFSLSGITFTSAVTTSFFAGPNLSNARGSLVLIEGQEPMIVNRVVDPLTLELRGASPFLNTEVRAKIGRARLVVEHEDTLAISTDPGYESVFTTLFPQPPTPPYPTWAISEDPVPVRAGDRLFVYSPEAPTVPFATFYVTEVESSTRFRVNPPFPAETFQVLFSTSPSSTSPRAMLESRGYVDQVQAEEDLRSFLSMESSFKKYLQSLRSAIYQAISLNAPNPFLIARLVAAIRDVTNALDPLLEILGKRTEFSLAPEFLRLEEYLENEGATSCLEAIQGCRWEDVLSSTSTDRFQAAFDRLRIELQTLLARDMEDQEEEQEEALPHDDNPDIDEEY